MQIHPFANLRLAPETISEQARIATTFAWVRQQGLAFWLLLTFIACASVLMRFGGIQWLVSVGHDPYFSFHPDERAVGWVQDFKAGSRDGYVLGMTTQLFALMQVLKGYLDLEPVVALRSITLLYAALTVVLTAILARSWGCSKRVSLLAAALLAVAPLHVVNSNFGTPDVTVVFLFYAMLLGGAAYFKTGRQIAFITAAVFAGAAFAVKFYMPLAVPFLILLGLQEQRRMFNQTVLAVAVATCSFEALSAFNYKPWDLLLLLRMLAFDNAVVTGGLTPHEQVAFYLWDSISALGLASWLFTMIGIAVLLRRLAHRYTELQATGAKWRTYIVEHQSALLFASAFAAHTAVIVLAQFHAPRHMLVYLPVACIAAAIGLLSVGTLFRNQILAALCITATLTYQIYNASTIQDVYAQDIRNGVARVVNLLANQGYSVLTLSKYSAVKGTQIVKNERELGSADFFVTCDLEFDRYFEADEAEKIFHAFGGQQRLDFYRALFAGRTEFVKLHDFIRALPQSPEIMLGKAGWLRSFDKSLQPFVPRRCVIFGNRVPSKD
jgi:hypothetical protein